MKEIYLDVARSTRSAQAGNAHASKKWTPPSGDQIRALRQRLGLSQAQFAQQFSMDINSLKNWEQGRSIPEMPARQLFWMIDANHEGARALIEEAERREAEASERH